MKINIWTLACLLMGLTACTDSSDELVQKENEITLKLINHEMSRSAGVPYLNENLIKNADIFFFAYDETTHGPTGNCLYHHQENDLGDDGVQTEHEFSISAKYFTDNTYYYIYAIANLEIDAEFNGTIDKLKAKAATPISVTTEENGKNGIQDHFVMDGFNNTFFYTKDMAGTTTIPLTRSAAKITLTVNVASSVTVGGATFTPQTSAMTVRMINGEKNGVVNGEATTSETLTTDYYSIDQTTKTHSVPFYSYPTNTVGENACYLELMIPWDSSNGTVNNNYYYIIPIETNKAEEPITVLERNHHYIVDVNVSILGSLREEPVILNPKFLVKNWSEVALDADLKNYRYLWVKEPANGKYWVMNNTEILEIPYTSSHDCERVVVSCIQSNLKDDTNSEYKKSFTTKDPGNTPGSSDYYCNLVDGKIVYKHGLDNTYTSSEFDFTPYEIKITIQHVDDQNDIDDELSETITIKQYPAIYGVKDINSDYTDDNDVSNNHGFVFVNGYYSIGTHNVGNGVSHVNLDKQDYFDPVNGKPSGQGVSANSMLVFTVTSTYGTNYIIGDPREQIVNDQFINMKHNNDISIWDQATCLYGEAPRYLQYYYATETSHQQLKYANSSNESRITSNEKPLYSNEEEAIANERTYNMIAPKFRISSGYGAISSPQNERRYYDMMKKRCASYQEDGYPAGRWRLPTMAEFRFIIFLSHHGKIPTLFAEGVSYWCAHGFGTPNDEDVTPYFYTDFGSAGTSVRCVYDDWYWGSEPVLTGEDKKTFTWGDEPITR